MSEIRQLREMHENLTQHNMHNAHQTALFIHGSTQEFWHAIATSECYDQIAAEYDELDFNNTNGTDLNGDPINLGDYPIRQRPGTRPSY